MIEKRHLKLCKSSIEALKSSTEILKNSIKALKGSTVNLKSSIEALKSTTEILKKAQAKLLQRFEKAFKKTWTRMRKCKENPQKDPVNKLLKSYFKFLKHETLNFN